MSSAASGRRPRATSSRSTAAASCTTASSTSREAVFGLTACSPATVTWGRNRASAAASIPRTSASSPTDAKGALRGTRGGVWARYQSRSAPRGRGTSSASVQSASASACSAASDFSTRRSSSTVVSARPSASTLISASAVTAATSTTPRSGLRRRDTDHLHQLAGGPARLRVDAHPHLAQRGVRRAADVALEVEAARTHALAVARLRRLHLRLGEERLREQHGARRLPVRRGGGHAAHEEALEARHAHGGAAEGPPPLAQREA